MSFFNIGRILLILLLVSFCVITYTFAIILVVRYLHINWILIQLLGWISWYFWHSVIFDKVAKLLCMLNLKDSFGIIVFTQVIPGVSFFFTMMSFPVLYSFYYKIPFATNFIQLSCGICTGLMGLYIIIESFRVIGISGAAFENDYSTNNRKKLVAHSIYGLIRHPLYMGSLIGSVGLSMVFSNLECFLFPLINTAFIPIYKYLEETRLIDIYGQEYMLYQKKVGAFWPKKLFWRKATIILKSKK